MIEIVKRVREATKNISYEDIEIGRWYVSRDEDLGGEFLVQKTAKGDYVQISPESQTVMIFEESDMMDYYKYDQVNLARIEYDKT